MQYIEKMKNITISSCKNLLDNVSDLDLKSIRTLLDDKYYNSSKPFIPDCDYDIFYEYLISRIPSEKYRIGAKLREDSNKTKLPYWLGSLDKKKDQKSISRWCESYQGPYFLTEKLDGISLMIKFSEKETKLYTRGNGEVGCDISYLSKYLELPKINCELSVRGELIIKTKNFEKYSEEFDNPRNMVAGVVNAKTLRTGIDVIDFVAYQILDTDEKLSDQFRKLKNYGFNVPRSKFLDKISEDTLSGELDLFKKDCQYAIDGLVIRDDKSYEVNDSGNPDYAFAFKRLGEVFETRVQEVEWNLTKSGILKPLVKVDPTKVGDVIISSVYGYNANFVNENGIGKGAVIEITRSGDVIPKILSVISPVEPELPSGKWYWNDSEIEIMADFTDLSYSRLFNIRYLYDLLSALGVLNLGESTMEKMYDNGFDKLEKIFECKEDSFKNIDRMGVKSSQRIYNSIRTMLETLTPQKLVGVSNILGQGIGEKKVNAILEVYPNIFLEEKHYECKKYMSMVNGIKGFSIISSEKIAKNMLWAKNMVKKFNKYFKKVEIGDKYSHLKVVFTGFRDKILEEKIKKNGGEVQSGISKKTTHLIIKDSSSKSTKTEKAEKMGIEILTLQEFLNIL